MFSHQLRSANFATHTLAPERAYAAADITTVICIRAHSGNPWVLERLDRLAGYYEPPPLVLIVDFGSPPPFAAPIREACTRGGFQYLRVEDDGVFSLSAARNAGAQASSTDLLYFTDIDFFSPPGHFADLACYATDHDFGVVRDIVLNLPAYHLSEAASGEFDRLPAASRDRFLAQVGAIAAEDTEGPLVEFIAPYSNNFLCTRDFFQLAGGYDPVFRGHGSEDFELMVRMAHYTGHAVLPDHVAADLHKPKSAAFQRPRPYAGFRRLGEAVSYRAESAGFRAFHLWHPTPESDPWRESNDWRRTTLSSAFAGYLDAPHQLAGIDHLPRRKRALCLCKDPEHFGYFLPFRILGYELIPVPDDEDGSIQEAHQWIEQGGIDLFLVFNPYMKSHARFLGLFRFAKESGVEIAVVERGALPSSIYFAPDVSYNDPDFTSYDAAPPPVDGHALAAADAIAAKIRGGAWTLESLSRYDETLAVFPRRPPGARLRVFLPLQLSDDMAVTCFVAPTQDYAAFESSIAEVARNHPAIQFVVKAHPLKRESFAASGSNILICANDDNVHALIDACDAVVCYNSGVGLLALIHGKPVVTIGNAFYNVADTGSRAPDLAAAIALVDCGEAPPPSAAAVRRFLAWLVTRKYSFFTASDHIREFHHRNSHGYRNIRVTHLNWKGISLPLGRISALSAISATSYINGRLGLMIGVDSKEFAPPPPPRGPVKSFLIHRVKRPLRNFLKRIQS